MIISVFRLDEHPESEIQMLPAGDASTGGQMPALRKGRPYLWAIISGLISGLADTKREVEIIAEQYGLTVDFRIRCENNEDFVEHLRHPSSKAPIVSYIKRQSGKYTLAAWHNYIDYVSCNDPFAFEDHYSWESLQTAAIKYGERGGTIKSPYIGYRDGITPVMCFSSGEITTYIRRKEAKRKFVTPSLTSSACQIEFIYVNYNEGNYRSNWQRHRVIKKTGKHIFIDSHPYRGKGYLRSGWQAMIVYATILDQACMEKNQCFYHKSDNLNYYTEKQARRRNKKLFIDGGSFAEPVLELPIDDIGWAIKILGLSWPAIAVDIKKAFSKAVMTHHPDRDGGSHEGFIECTRAKEFLLFMLQLNDNKG